MKPNHFPSTPTLVHLTDHQLLSIPRDIWIRSKTLTGPKEIFKGQLQNGRAHPELPWGSHFVSGTVHGSEILQRVGCIKAL